MSLNDRTFEVGRNIENFSRMLATEQDPAKRRTLRQLLREERTKLSEWRRPELLGRD